MRRWGIVISLLYVVILLGLLLPAGAILAGDDWLFSHGLYNDVRSVYTQWSVWLAAGLLIVSQAMLLFLSVDTSWKKLKARTHILVTCVVTSLLVALLTFALILSVDAAAKARIADAYLDSWAKAFGICGVFWALWGVVFFYYLRNSSAAVSRAVAWLLRGSVLELLIAVPSHVIVRRRDECCAPILTSFGIVTGIAVMLLSFGPAILMLYKKRIDDYRARKSGALS